MEGKKNIYRFSYSDTSVANPETIDQLIDTLYSAPSDKLVSGEFNGSVEMVIQYASSVKNREMLERLAFVLFSGPRSRKFVRDDDGKAYSACLLLLFSYKSSYIADITFTLRLCFETWKTVMKRSGYAFYPIDRTLSEHIPWEFEGIDPEDEIIITHAGGFLHINAFLQKKSLGYTLEQGGLGIQVNATMATHAKSLIYAQRSGPRDSLDTPAILMATIKSKFLHRARNPYEAGLRCEHLDYLQNVQVIKLPYSWLCDENDIIKYCRKIEIKARSICCGLDSRVHNLHRLMTTNSEKIEASWREMYNASYDQIKTKLEQSTLNKLTIFTL